MSMLSTLTYVYAPCLETCATEYVTEFAPRSTKLRGAFDKVSDKVKPSSTRTKDEDEHDG